MLSFKSMAKAASRRRETLRTRIASAKQALASMEKELSTLDRILDALSATDLKTATGRGRRRRGGKWRPGRPGRPPKWYIERQKAKGRVKPEKKAPRKKKRAVSAKVLAGLARAREALAKKRAAAAQPAAL